MNGGEHSEYFDLKEDETVPEEEAKAEPDATPHLSEFKQQRDLHRLVSLRKSLKGIQFVKKRKQLASLH